MFVRRRQAPACSLAHLTRSRSDVYLCILYSGAPPLNCLAHSRVFRVRRQSRFSSPRRDREKEKRKKEKKNTRSPLENPGSSPPPVIAIPIHTIPIPSILSHPYPRIRNIARLDLVKIDSERAQLGSPVSCSPHPAPPRLRESSIPSHRLLLLLLSRRFIAPSPPFLSAVALLPVSPPALST
ncbi:hypothetical protein GGS23DRAFT_471318 [Durotheca rogersii]|uniref:uncharacterized protein n=1 Tax=Durotheca rogersii TaxID=419775 RepID=UPI00221E578B|nr:uncharacterized protein GGS23DRAFT_471318 [Durotheca rogersii]KAI5855002.1 hypothetical protein GGS23DRAFT_471318 [Durotheca rogersii]